MSETTASNEVSPASSPGGKKREEFSTRWGILLATLGSAVGLGNIWKFPTLTGTNGGAAFLIVYIVAVILIGIPVLVSELAIGRTARANAVDAFKKITNKPNGWWLIGGMGVVASFLIMAFYTEVAGWVLAYVVKAFNPASLTTDAATLEGAFGSLVSSPIQALVWQWVDLLIVGGIILLGVTKGIERFTKRLLPLLVTLLLIVAIRSLTLPGGSEGIKFLFNPDFSKLTGPVILAAVGLAFFKLSEGMGVMLVYGSYFKSDQDIPATGVRVAFADMAIALLAGLAIFPAVFAYGFQPAAGPSLIFMTLPAVFASMPFGQFFFIIFMVLTFIASIGAQISLLEGPVSFIIERTKLTRVQASVLVVLGIAVVGALAALSSSTLANVKVFGKTFFDFFDFTTSNVLLPLGGLALSIFAGWFWGKENYLKAITNNGTLNNAGFANVLYTLTKYVAPVLLLVVLLNGFGIFG